MSLPWLAFFLLVALSATAQKPLPPPIYANPAGALKTYQENLIRLRREHNHQQELPDLKFFLFGMGNRQKLIYRNGRLLDALTGNIEEQWRVEQEIIVPSEYLVHLVLTDKQTIEIREDENGVWVLESGKRPRLLPRTRSPVKLPPFTNHPYAPVLRVLHHEVLINVLNSRPFPNFMVYFKPRYRDAALMAMVLRETQNLSLIYKWIMALRDPFDRANQGVTEADNPGQVLFLVSLVADRNHPAVAPALDSVARFRQGNSILGRTDGAEHPVFQTKWLKYGLKSLGLPDPYVIPTQYDSYASLFWWDFEREPTTGKRFDTNAGTNAPYLTWAQDHFYGEKHGRVGTADYPLSWEQQSRTAHYPGMTVLDKELVKQKLTYPHAWHAAEMFLLLNQR